MGRDDIFHLAGKDIEAAGDDHVLLAVDNAQKAVGITHRDIAGVEPAALEGLFGLFRLVQIAQHHLRAAHANFARLPICHWLAIIIKQGNLHPGRLPAA